MSLEEKDRQRSQCRHQYRTTDMLKASGTKQLLYNGQENERQEIINVIHNH